VNNFSVLCAHKTVPEALEGLISSGRATVQALLCPPHVSAIIGTRPYERLTARGVPCVIGGFEPLDILLAVGMLLEQLAAKQARVENEYSRVVRPNGNERAKALLEDVFEPCDAIWRGLGMVPKSGLRLNARYSNFDAAQRFSVQVEPAQEPAGCRCGEVLLGNINPVECPLFGTVCTPEDPVGACMVSSEGTCAAHFRYGGHQ
jgi:hydrogenase expression/formation protein HypD